MKRLISTLSLLALLATAGCMPIGALYTDVKGPMSFHEGATTNLGSTMIAGEACATSILNLVAIGDWSIEAALKAAGADGKTLKNIAVDHRVFSILGIYQNHCTRVHAQVAQ